MRTSPQPPEVLRAPPPLLPRSPRGARGLVHPLGRVGVAPLASPRPVPRAATLSREHPAAARGAGTAPPPPSGSVLRARSSAPEPGQDRLRAGRSSPATRGPHRPPAQSLARVGFAPRPPSRARRAKIPAGRRPIRALRREILPPSGEG